NEGGGEVGLGRVMGRAGLWQTDRRSRRIAMPDGPVTEQPIAAAGLCLQQTPVRAEGLADRTRVNLKGIFHDNGAGPDAPHQFVFGDKLARRLNQNFDKLKSAPANRCGRSKNTNFAALKVNLARARGIDRSNSSSHRNGARPRPPPPPPPFHTNPPTYPPPPP